MKSSNSQKRIIGYDLAKTLSMLLVVLIHFTFYTRSYPNTILGNLISITYVICVPLFFAVNGALVLPRPLNMKKHIKRLLTIIIVVEIWKVFAGFFFVFLDRSYALTVKNWIVFLLGGNLGNYPTGYFWFMNALIAVYISLPVIKTVFDSQNHTSLYWLVGALTAFTVILNSLVVILQMLSTLTSHDLSHLLDSMQEFNLWGQYGYVLLYFVAGGILSRESYQPESKKLNRLSTPLSLAIVAILLCTHIRHSALSTRPERNKFYSKLRVLSASYSHRCTTHITYADPNAHFQSNQTSNYIFRREHIRRVYASSFCADLCQQITI